MDWIIIGGLLIIIVMQILLRPKQLNNNKEDLEKLLNEIQRSFDRIEKNFREDFRLNREESRLVAKDNREELAHSMNEFREAFERGIDSFNRLQKEKFAALDERQQRLVDNTEKRLEEIRVTVDEKLQKTLNDRIGQSFRLVTEQLESVQKGLGEMQTLAQDVGGLKRVLSNVKTRGNIGDTQVIHLYLDENEQKPDDGEDLRPSSRHEDPSRKLQGIGIYSGNLCLHPSIPQCQR